MSWNGVNFLADEQERKMASRKSRGKIWKNIAMKEESEGKNICGGQDIYSKS